MRVICLQRQQGWEVTFQRAHALMAAQILAHWRPEDRPTFWVELLAACAQHDNGWTEWEPGGRLSEAGAPMDFRHMAIEFNLIQAKRVVALGWHQDRVVGWLVSRHMHQIYDPRRGELGAMDTWLGQEERRRAKATRHLEHEEEELERAYAMLYWCDTLSLVLCEEQVPFGGRRVEVAKGPGGRGYQVWEGEGAEEVQVWPWPLAGESLEVSVESYLVKQLSFADHDAFLGMLDGLVPLRRTFRLRPGSAFSRAQRDLLGGKTVEELQVLAREHQVPGRSGMNKAQLVQALVGQVR